MLPPAARIPLRVVVPNNGVEAEDLVPKAGGEKAAVEDMTAFGAEWSGMKQLTLTFKKAGDGLDLSFPVEEEEYDVNMYVHAGPALRKRCRITQGERTVASVRRVRGRRSYLPGRSCSRTSRR